MKRTLFATVALLALAGMPADASDSDARSAARAQLIEELGDLYDPTEIVEVRHGLPHDFAVTSMPWAEAIELHLDLGELAGLGGGSGEGDLPASGELFFKERGWAREGALCPTIDDYVPPEVHAVYGVWPADDPHLGVGTTDVSQFAVNKFGQQLWSRIVEKDPTTGAETVIAYQHETIEFGYYMTFACTKTSTLVMHDSYVLGEADRV